MCTTYESNAFSCHNVGTLSKDHTANTMPAGAKLVPCLRIVEGAVA